MNWELKEIKIGSVILTKRANILIIGALFLFGILLGAFAGLSEDVESDMNWPLLFIFYIPILFMLYKPLKKSIVIKNKSK